MEPEPDLDFVRDDTRVSPVGVSYVVLQPAYGEGAFEYPVGAAHSDGERRSDLVRAPFHREGAAYFVAATTETADRRGGEYRQRMIFRIEPIALSDSFDDIGVADVEAVQIDFDPRRARLHIVRVDAYLGGKFLERGFDRHIHLSGENRNLAARRIDRLGDSDLRAQREERKNRQRDTKHGLPGARFKCRNHTREYFIPIDEMMF